MPVRVSPVEKSSRGGVGGVSSCRLPLSLLLVLRADREEHVVQRGLAEPRLDLCRRTLDQDAAAPHEADLVGLVRLLHEVRRDDDGGSAGGAVDEESPCVSLDGFFKTPIQIRTDGN